MYDSEYETVCDAEKKLNEARYWLENIVQQLYMTEDLDILDLENCLDELVHLFGLKLPKGDLQVRRKVTATQHPIMKSFDVEAWKNWNNQYLKQLA